MSGTIKFMDAVIRNLKPETTRTIYWCDGCPGFGLRLMPSGAKSFIFKYMSDMPNGKRLSRWITIGKYPAISIRKARQQYDALYEAVHEYSRDPVAEEKAKEEQKRARLNVSELIPLYLENAKLKGKKSVTEEERVFNVDLLPLIADKYVDEIEPSDIEKLQARILSRAKSRDNATRGGKVAVKNSLAYTRQLFNFALKRNLITRNPVLDIESLGQSGQRSRVLNFEEIWTFWHGLEDTGVPPVTANALRFALVTMQRSKEVRLMRYDALKNSEGVWQMEREDTKNRTMHRVPLNRYALDLIEAVKPYTENSSYIFAATRASTPPKTRRNDLIPLGNSAFSQAVRRFQSVTSIEDICPHDLRRTGATWITAVGLPKLYARLMLNHSDGERDVTGEVYVQYSYDFEKERAAKVWEFILDQIVNCDTPKDIPSLNDLREMVNKSGLI